MSDPGFFKWTEESDAALREMIADGKTRREIGRHFGINVAQVGGRAYRLGLTKPNGRRGQPKKKADAE